MRLIIRDDPQSASAYIAKYIIGMFSRPAIRVPSLTTFELSKTESSTSTQHQSTHSSSVSQLDQVQSKSTISSLRDTKPERSPSKMSLHLIWYISLLFSYLAPLSSGALRKHQRTCADYSMTIGRIYWHPTRTPRILPHFHVQALLLSRQCTPTQYPYPEWQCARPRGGMCCIRSCNQVARRN